ncbi:MAG: glycosyltransferase family 4 protein [Clostridiales bacterium]|nr:glycosyltransferase family 4 protein [Clostridiales bacterium]
MKKSVLFITHLYYPSLGGAERVFQKIAEGLARRGFRVTVLTSDALSTEQYFTLAVNNLPACEVLNGVRVIREPLRAKIYRYLRFIDRPLRKAGRLGVFLRPLFFGPHFGRGFREVLKEKAEVVVAGPTPTSAVFYGLYYKMKNPQSEFVVFPHMHIEDRLHTAPINLWAIKRADAVPALTDAEKKYLRARGVKEGKIKRVVNGVDEVLLRAPRAEATGLKDYVLYLGQEGEHKRIPLLIEAMRNLWEKGSEAPLVIAGARTNFSYEIDRIIRNLPPGARSKIFRFNNFSEEQKTALLDNCLMMVNPSAYEAFGIVFLEAWARGKPVIGADIRALREIIRDGQNGLLFDALENGDLERKILKILENSELGLKMGQAGHRDISEKYTWDRIVDKIVGTFFPGISTKI